MDGKFQFALFNSSWKSSNGEDPPEESLSNPVSIGEAGRSSFCWEDDEPKPPKK